MSRTLDLHNRLRIFALLLGFALSSSAFAYDPIDCLEDISKADPGIVVGLATKLCSGAWSPEPVKCYAVVPEFDKSIPRGIAIDLCAGSTSAENTIKCYVRAGDRGLIRGLATTLCGARKQEK